MKAPDFIGKVAATQIEHMFDGPQSSRVLLAILGLRPEVACAIAREVSRLHLESGKVAAFVHPDMAQFDIGAAKQSNQTATFHRHHFDNGIGLTLFTVPTAEIGSVEQSLAHVEKIDDAWLMEETKPWARHALPGVDEFIQRQFAEVLNGLVASDVVSDAHQMAEFALKVGELMTDPKQGLSLGKAVRRALPALHLPCDAGDPRADIEESARNAESFFREVFRDARPALYLRGKDGEPLNPIELRKKLSALRQTNAISPAGANVLEHLIGDNQIGDEPWTESQAEAASLPWEETEKLFGGEKRKQKLNFGQETLDLHKKRSGEVLTPADLTLLGELKRDNVQPSNRHDDFFARHKSLLSLDPKLYRRWERLVFRRPVEATDLADGLIRLAHRARQAVGDEDEVDDLRLYIRMRGASVPAFWTEDKSTKLCRLIRDRWRGLPALLAPDIVLDFGRCWTDWEYSLSGKEEVDARGKSHVEFEFEAFYLPSAVADAPKETDLRAATSRAQMWWRPHPNSFATAFPLDLSMIRPVSGGLAPLLAARISANRYDRNGAVQSINLDDTTTVTDATGDSHGCLACPRQTDSRVDVMWVAALDGILNDNVITNVQHKKILAAYDVFRERYSRSIEAMLAGNGLADPVLLEQAESYGNLLKVLAREAIAEICVRDLWKPLLRIGTATVETARPTVLVSPLHPLRMGEIGVKARQFASAIRKVATSRSDLASELESFVDEASASQQKTYYVDVGLSGHVSSPILLVESRRLDDFSLLEPATTNDAEALADEPAEETVKAFERTTTEYLTLRPHERSNFSTVLIDAESEDLPVALANSMARRIEDEPGLRCDLVVTHDDVSRLRRIYEQQNRRIGHEVEGALASESTRNFLSRLRVGIVNSELLSANEGKKHDIVVLQDVIAKRAEVKWTRVRPPVQTTMITHVAATQSKRKPFRRGDTTTGTFLTAPSHPSPVCAYVDALHDVLAGRASEAGEPWLPLQEVEFKSGDVNELLKRAHRLGVWVMTFDRLADKRLLGNNERRIVRNFSLPRSDHNVIISTEISAATLGERLRSDLVIALPSAGHDELDQITTAVHKSSANLSGAIVMRGAQRVNHAHELLGLVLAKREIDRLLSRDSEERQSAWFFLDDFIPWLGVAQSRADILAVDFAIRADAPCIRLVVGEAKFVSGANLTEQRNRSLSQLEATYGLLEKRFGRADGTVDPTMWRARLADMAMEQIEPFEQIGGIPYADWIAGLRYGSYPVEVTGHSLVFVHDMSTNPSDQPFIPDDELPAIERRPLAQWVFGRPGIATGLRDLLNPAADSQISIPKEWGSHNQPEPFADLANAVPVPLELAIPVAESAPLPVELSRALHESTETSAPRNGVPSSVPDAGEVPHGWKPGVYKTIQSMGYGLADDSGSSWLEETIKSVRNALQREKMDAPILGSRLTPNSGLIYLDGKAVTVSWLEKNQTDLKTRYGLDIIRITPLPNKIAIGVRRPKRATLHLADAWLRRQLEQSAPNLNLAPIIGEKEDDGSLFYLPIAAAFGEQEMAAPHTLVSGTTGSGKGILASSLLLDLCAFNSPENLELRLIDPKRGIDYAWLKKMPHLRGGIVSDKEAAIELIRDLVGEMETRYSALEASGCNNIGLFNVRNSNTPMPRIVVFFDEVPNWMQDEDFKDEIEPLLNEIATKSRAAGIHLFMIYQRADNQVMTMQLRTNLGNKLVLRLGDEGSSKIALNEKGAERLLGKGHVIAKLDSDDKIYGQVPFIGQDEVFVLAQAIAKAWHGGKETQETAELATGEA